MANPVGNVGTYLADSYGRTSSNREDLTDWIADVTPTDTKLTDSMPTATVRSTYHQWQTDSLRARKTRGIVEGRDWDLDTQTAPSRQNNHTEIFGGDYAVTKSQMEENPAGFSDLLAYLGEKEEKAARIDLEVAWMADSTSSQGASATGRVMKTLEDFITTNVKQPTDYTGSPSTADSQAGVPNEDDVNDLLQLIYEAGGSTDVIVVAGSGKRWISQFTANQTKNILAEAKKIVNTVDVYESDFGLIKVMLNRHCPQSTNTSSVSTASTDVSGRWFFLESAMVRKGVFRDFKHTVMGTRGDSIASQLTGEFTLEVGNELALGVMKGVNNFTTGATA